MVHVMPIVYDVLLLFFLQDKTMYQRSDKQITSGPCLFFKAKNDVLGSFDKYSPIN